MLEIPQTNGAASGASVVHVRFSFLAAVQHKVIDPGETNVCFMELSKNLQGIFFQTWLIR